MVASIGSAGITHGVSLMDEYVSEDDIEKSRDPKKAKFTLSNYESPHDDVVAEASKLQDNSSSSSILPIENQTRVLRIHTDGSSLGNGKDGARAGVGVYFGAADPRYVLFVNSSTLLEPRTCISHQLSPYKHMRIGSFGHVNHSPLTRSTETSLRDCQAHFKQISAPSLRPFCGLSRYHLKIVRST
jgi:hypothetical protein